MTVWKSLVEEGACRTFAPGELQIELGDTSEVPGNGNEAVGFSSLRGLAE